MSSNQASRGQYQHYIPRFILRRFQPDYETQQMRSRKQRQKAFQKSRKKGIDPEQVNVYSLATGKLDIRPIAKIYGEQNLYQFNSPGRDIDHLENLLAGLENETSAVIKDIHDSLGSGTFQTNRMKLEQLRKFIFLMKYRTSRVSKTYFQNYDQQNYLTNYMTAKGYSPDTELWLDGLQYFLETPHPAILAHATSNQSQPGYSDFVMNFPRVQRQDVEHIHSDHYEHYMNSYYLAILEASDDSEFILGDNSQGLWEGTMSYIPGAHIIYVISPKVVLLLKSNYSRNPQFFPFMDVQTVLGDIPIHSAETIYANGRTYKANPANMEEIRNTFFELQKYKGTPEAQRDSFIFRVTKLSTMQTYSINEIILQNLHDDGTITFSSPERTLRTIQQYNTPFGSFSKENREKLSPLLVLLSQNDPDKIPKDDSSQSNNIRSSSETYTLRTQRSEVDLIGTSTAPLDNIGIYPNSIPIPFRVSQLSQIMFVPGFFEEPETQADLVLRLSWDGTLQGRLQFRSNYDRAMKIAHLVRNTDRTKHPIAEVVHNVSSRIIEKFLSRVPQAEQDTKCSGTLVESLSPKDSRTLWQAMEQLMKDLDVAKPPPDMFEKDFATLLSEVIIIEFLERLVAHKCHIAEKLVFNIDFVVYVDPPPLMEREEEIDMMIGDGEHEHQISTNFDDGNGKGLETQSNQAKEPNQSSGDSSAVPPQKKVMNLVDNRVYVGIFLVLAMCAVEGRPPTLFGLIVCSVVSAVAGATLNF